MNNLTFRLCDIMDLKSYVNNGTKCLKYNLDDEYYETDNEEELYDILSLYEIIDIDYNQYYDYQNVQAIDEWKKFIYSLLQSVFYKYKKYNIKFDLPSDFIRNFLLIMKKRIINYHEKRKFILKCYNITDDELYTNEKSFTANAHNNAILDTSAQETYLDNFKGFVDYQAGRKVINNKYDAIIKRLISIQDNELTEIINDCKPLFVLVKPQNYYLYE